ncbi:MAG: ribosomal L7Ae/L30e/S12e/Gadd45 family protein [Firmicutes bacterium]|nr:ribosomal L7Ae/L30e/S12e/Gadd45 family protein [Bacillota bacterium]
MLDVYQQVRTASHKVAGIRQVQRALNRDSAILLVVAEDAEARLTAPLVQLAEKRRIAVQRVPSMRQLGRACRLEVGTAACLILQKS